ncbi:S41 family peptidase [Maribacter sp. IgM3_T14_3]|uniref:S41 family peptidase n=1 Tax=Maribacter sp. IgM3_T14_3 TaxID=3415140 RepID=UPI003C6EB6F2
MNSNIDWDDALKDQLPLVALADFDGEIGKWLGNNIKPCKIKDNTLDSVCSYSVKADYRWLRDKTLFTPILSEDLLGYDCFYPNVEKHTYVTNGQWNVTPEFKEASYHNVEVWKSEYYKILSLFRFWNIIEYFHPYKYLNTNNWDDVLKEFIPRFLESHGELSYKLMLMELFSRIEDSHGGLHNDKTIDGHFGTKQIPVELFLLNGEVVVKDIFSDFKDKTQVKLGDVVTHIDGITVQFLMESNRKTIVASNVSAMNRELMQRLVRTQKDVVEVTILNQKTLEVEEVEVPTLEYSVLSYIMKDVPSHRVLNDDIGYIYPGSLKSIDEVNTILDTFKNKRAIVLDYRCYPSIILQHSLPEFILPHAVEYYTATHFDWKNLGSFYYQSPVAIGKENSNYYKGKLVVLLNEFSTSQPEFETLVYKKGPNTMVIGSNSGGTIGNYTAIVLPGNIVTMMSGAEVRDVDKTQIQKVGIVPDIYVERTKEGIRQGKDEILEKALDYINRKSE